MNTHKIFLSTQGEYTGTINNINFKIQPIVLGNTDEYEICIALESFSCPLAINMINETNNIIEVNDVSCVIPVGNYNITNLLAYLNEFFINNVVFTYSPTQNKIKVASVNLTTYTIGPNTTSKKILGCVIGSYDNDIFFNFPVNLVSTSGIIIQLQNIFLMNYDNVIKSNNILSRIPITCGLNQYLQYFNPLPMYVPCVNRTIQYLNIVLLDDNYTLLNLSDNVDWSICLRIDYIKKENKTNLIKNFIE